ncbi:DnaJ domain-containing protein [Myxococcus faecalis]|uniref:J domain-containing protein n=1 Tax=Myxococcus faecalis TaxID=3115646 RepID=UPI003CF216C1
MRACPCCLETLTPGLLGFGSRRLAGHCEACGDAVCQSCLSVESLAAAVFQKRAGASEAGSRKVKGRVCRSCLWEALVEAGRTPSFAAPRGQRERARRAARETCTHAEVKACMGFCPTCGDEVVWKSEHGNPACEACGAPSHRFFNCCWNCGESFDEQNVPQSVARGYRLDFDCDAEDCAGKLAWLMPFCPWCGEEKHWEHPGALECEACEVQVDRGWAFCVRCGEEAPLPDACPRCGVGLDEAASAARCEQCQHVVCGECCDVVVTASGGESRERLLCSTCGEGAEPVADTRAAEEPEPEPSEAEEDEDSEEEEAEASEEPRREEEPAPRPQAPPPSPWEVLGVVRGAPLADVKRAYLALVAQYHPDKVAQLGPKLQALAQEETRRIIEAWEHIRKHSRPSG